MGENGAGKTTLGHILAGVLRPDQGTLIIGDSTIGLNSHSGAVFPKIGLVRQNNIWPENLKVWEAAVLGLTSLKSITLKPVTEFRRTAEEWGITCPDPKINTANLDAADFQRCQLIAALMRKPQFLILDEPVPDWGNGGKDHFFDQLRQFAEAGMGILLITHRLDDVFRIATWITVMRKGEIAASGSVSDFDTQSTASYMFGTGLTPSPAHNNNTSVKDTEAPPLSKKTVLECRDISYRQILKSTNFEICAGEIFGIAGIRGEGAVFTGKDHLRPSTAGIGPTDSERSDGKQRMCRNAPGRTVLHSVGCVHSGSKFGIYSSG